MDRPFLCAGMVFLQVESDRVSSSSESEMVRRFFAQFESGIIVCVGFESRFTMQSFFQCHKMLQQSVAQAIEHTA